MRLHLKIETLARSRNFDGVIIGKLISALSITQKFVLL